MRWCNIIKEYQVCMRTVSNQMLLSRKIFQIIFSSMSLLSQRYCIYDVAATILEWGFPSTTHTYVCTVSIQMLIPISTIKENIQLTKIRLSQSLERDIFLHFYIIFENSEISSFWIEILHCRGRGIRF